MGSSVVGVTLHARAPGTLQVVGVDAEGHRRQQQHPGAGVVGVLAGPAADLLDLEIVGAVGHVQVVRLGGAEGQHRHLPALRADEGVSLLGQDAFAHGRVACTV